MIGLLVKRAFIALAIFVFYFFVADNILNGLGRWMKIDFGRFLPLEMSDRLTPVPAFLGKVEEKWYNDILNGIPQQLGLTILLTVIAWVFCFWLHKRRDL